MGTVTTVILAILVFGGLIFIHEFGHYITARIFKVTITEFSIGMGPRLVSYDSKKTGIKYSLAMFPFGGFVSMPGESGEDEESADDPNRFDKKPAWQRFIIVGAGAFVNIIAGFIIMIIITSVINIGSTTVAQFTDATKEGFDVSSADSGLMVGDEITTTGGIMGRIVTVKDDSIVLETGADRTKMKITRWAIQTNNTAEDRLQAERAAQAQLRHRTR